MKKFEKIAILITLFIFVFPVIAIAESEQPEGIVPRRENVSPAIPPINNRILTPKTSGSTSTKPKIEYMKGVREERAGIVEERKNSIQDIRTERKDMLKNASNTPGARREIINNMNKETAQIRHTALVKQLRLSILNLENAYKVVEGHINKVGEKGIDVNQAKQRLDTTKDKIQLAKTAVENMAKWQPVSAVGTSTVNVVKARTIGEEAIKAIKEARESLRSVIENLRSVIPKNKPASTTPRT